jgi:ERCC4-related helicase
VRGLRREHPKLKSLIGVLLDHFQKTPSSRAIVFCEFQDVVLEIAAALKHHEPRLRASHFVGRRGGKGRGMTQRQQLSVLRDFRADKLNVLVATCIGEEGLDIGEVCGRVSCLFCGLRLP